MSDKDAELILKIANAAIQRNGKLKDFIREEIEHIRNGGQGWVESAHILAHNPEKDPKALEERYKKHGDALMAWADKLEAKLSQIEDAATTKEG